MPVGEADTSIVRLVIGREGTMVMETDLVIRFDYGLSVPWVNRLDKKTLMAIAGPSMLVLRTPVKLHGQDLHSVGRFTVKRGQTIPFVLTYVPSHLKPPPPPNVEDQRERTEAFWRDWAQRGSIKGKWSGHVRRSLVTLKGLSFRPTGIVAAPTTSLPESLGGVRNWDYRFCWLRDAAFTLLALLNAGYSGVDGLPQGEGAFLPCSFWLVDIYVLMGRLAEAEKLFERLLKCRNDVGLLSEEYDPREKRMLGNFPQAFSHVALINSALCLLHAIGELKHPRLQQRHQKTASAPPVSVALPISRAS